MDRCRIDWIWENSDADDDESSTFGWNDTFESEPDEETCFD